MGSGHFAQLFYCPFLAMRWNRIKMSSQPWSIDEEIAQCKGKGKRIACGHHYGWQWTLGHKAASASPRRA